MWGVPETSAELGLPFAGRGSALGQLGTTWWWMWIWEQGLDSQYLVPFGSQYPPDLWLSALAVSPLWTGARGPRREQGE